ncbi:ferrous iron transport protein B [Petroclostridium sp. X23]|uniref:ferrous iron transport protein B n=1 Tax=Petroclostridium sp. X23 TaxID=3045146 RepID=UPI0024AE42AD|nr:ferrous iron transport protein B [Petroclostridium sp. X23]WHH58735.1 ferrous iron transport protein B [Petroclostridium sp. X23]
MKIALAGNPNSGKTTLFNAITGKTEYVGNWPGVTVEKKEADLQRKFRKIIANARVVDLPGAYSIAPYTSEEAITRNFVLGENPDVIINIVDASSLERSLYFTSQLLELGIPVVIALNKQDVVRRYGNKIDVEGLAKTLQCPVVETVANDGEGLKELMHAAADSVGAKKAQAVPQFSGKGTEGEDKARQQFVKEVVSKHLEKKRDASKVTVSDRIDRIVANGFLGLPIFAVVMWLVYAFSIEGLGGFLSGYFNDTLFGEMIPDASNGFLEGIGVHPLLQALIVDGAIGGVGAVIGFLPLIMVLFFCLGLLEDSGYMARVAVVMDRYFKKIGLSGKSIIPMIVGSGCSIPGVMATRTIEDINEKRMTTMLTPFVPCGAKLPIIALFSAVFFPDASWVAPSMYILAFVMIAIGGLILKKIFVWENTSTFIMELPEYKIPSLVHAFKQMIKQAKAFIIKASTIILVMNTLIWFMQTYSWRLEAVEDAGLSILASIGGVIAPLLIPLGFVGWQLAAAALTGFIAKENVVATFAIILLAASEDALHMPGGVLTELFNPVTAYAYLVFNLFTPPCFAAIGAMNSELDSRKWLGRAVLFQLSVGYLLAMLITQIGTMIVYGELAVGFVPAIIVSILFTGLIVYLIKGADRKRIQTPALVH